MWQDGTEEKDVPTTQLYYSISLDDHEFFPGEWVVSEVKDESGKYGAVQNVNYLERTASVRIIYYIYIILLYLVKLLVERFNYRLIIFYFF